MIIIIEDQPAQAKVIEMALKEVGVQSPIRHYTDVGRALNEIFSSPQEIEAIITDIHLPGKIEATIMVSEIKEHLSTKNLPIVMVSAENTNPAIVELQETYQIPFVKKSHSISEFSAALNQALLTVQRAL